MNAKPANAKIRELFRKLQALAERGVDGERDVARRKLARLKERYDFTVPDVADGPDLFSGRFTNSSTARPIYSFKNHEIALASSVKWALEAATKIRCLHRAAFLMGLYDGMMGDARDPGQRLPGGSAAVRKRKTRTSPADKAAGMRTHPYSIAVGLGKQIRFSAPLEQIAAELEAVAPRRLAPDQS